MNNKMKKQVQRLTQIALMLFVFMGMLNIANAQWQQTSLNSNSINSIVVHDNTIYAGTNNGVYLSNNNGTSWTPIGLSGSYVVKLAYDNNIIYALVGSGFAESVLYYSSNNGNTWSGHVFSPGNTSTVAALAVSGNTIVIGCTAGEFSFISTDNGNTWTHTHPNLQAITIIGNNILGGAGMNGGLSLSTDNGSTWTSLNNGIPSNVSIASLAVSGNNIFAATSDYGDDGYLGDIYMSPDNGSDWIQVNNNMINGYIYSLVINGNTLYAGTDNGIYKSTDNGSSWIAMNTGLISLDIRTLALNGNNVFAGTGNNGLWEYSNNTFPIGSKIRVGADSTISYWDGSAWIPVVPGLPGQSLHFTNGSPTWINPTDIDGNAYDVVTIGTQTWMKQNLNVTHYRNGDAIPNVTDNNTWANLATGAYCNYNNDSSYTATYGRYYNWYTVVDSRNLCPTGWHVPGDAEWTTLTDYLGGVSIAGGKLKEAGLTHWISPNTAATNETGFTALPGGYRDNNGTYVNIGYFGYWWSYTESNTSNAWSRNMGYVHSYAYRDYDNETYGFSVRCLKD